MTDQEMRKLEHHAKYARRHAEALYALTRVLAGEGNTHEARMLAGAARRSAAITVESDSAVAIYRFTTETP